MEEFKFDSLTITYCDIKDIVYDYAILPWGAFEPHNYHLPYLTDCYTAYHVSMDAVKKAYTMNGIKGMVLPPVPFGMQNPGQHTLPFCLHTRYETQKAILTDIVASLDRQGIKKLFIINGHGGNSFKPMVRDLAVEYPDFLVAVSDWYAILPYAEFFDEKGDHADEMETSVMLHYRPDLVPMERAGEGSYTPFSSQMLCEGVAWVPRNWSKASIDTGIGNPRKATAEKGRKFAEGAINKLSQLFTELVRESLYK